MRKVKFLHFLKEAFPTVKLITIWAEPAVSSPDFWPKILWSPANRKLIKKAYVRLVTVWKTLKESLNLYHMRKLKNGC